MDEQKDSQQPAPISTSETVFSASPPEASEPLGTPEFPRASEQPPAYSTPEPPAPPPPALPPTLSSTPPGAPPPPPLAPPPLMSVPPPGKPRGGLFWKVLALVALALLGMSLFANFKNLGRALAGHGSRSASYGLQHERTMEEVVIQRTNSQNKIVVIDVAGVITSDSYDENGMGMVESIREQLKWAAKDDDVKAVVLKVDSPGGEVLASDEINKAIARFQEQSDKPVIASMGSMAASGGYYVSAPCRWIVANDLTLTGSIGVIMHGYNIRGLMNKVGVRPQVFKSGKFKDMLSWDQEPDINKLPPDERETRLQEQQMVQDLVDETFAQFKKVVREGRSFSNKQNEGKGRRLVSDWTEYADGRVFSGKQALEWGFVDELGNFDAAVERARRIAGIKAANLIKYREPFDLSSVFRLFGKTETPALKVDLGFDGARLKAGHMYFILPTVVQ